ncbi:hypothetical protein PDENDC454_14227 [Paenibacillus dendritiformis C454]|uniref:ABC transporter permease n=1 Tax=Paenibacillus dendritiformis C454 TaxID=1131935 RepID=H3SH38_9BACL|nr:ABC transporter permease [Paenibacillus dendritiformis]EHQ61656.1 hypothetical protein PDENDC454_14227 [Paenibacillus dendritiformis C454]
MIRTKNGRTVFHIAKRSLQANRLRNLIIVCAVVLTTLLITSVFTMGFSINRSMELAQMKTAGSDFHGSFKYLKPDEAEKLIRHPSVKQYGKSVLVGRAANAAFKGTTVEINQIDDTMAEHSFVTFKEGGLPSRENEIAMNTWTLDLLGVPHEIGAKVRLDMDINGQHMSKDFILSGYSEADRYVAMSGLVFVSEPFVQKNIAHIDPEASRRTGSYANTIRLDVMFNNAWHIEKKIKNVLSETGVDASYGVNWAYTSVSFSENIANALPYAGLVLIIMLSGYLLIYNIFHISVVKDITFYGLLKTIGTTPRQLRKIISIQANLLYVVALPLGLALGYGIGRWVTPMITGLSSEKIETSYSASPFIFAGAALFSYMTVRIAANKPGRMAARIAPVEAVKFAGISGSSRRKTRRTVHGARLSRMSLANLLRHKKKLFLMLASLSLSIILFGTIYTVISSFNMNKYLNSFISGDFVVKEASAGGRRAIDKAGYALTEDIGKALGAIDGVKSLDKVYYKELQFQLNETVRSLLEPVAAAEDPGMPVFTSILEKGAVWVQLHGIDSGWIDVIQKSDIAAGAFDREKFDSGDYVLITETALEDDQYASYYEPGDRIKLDGMEKSYAVLAVMKPDALYAAGTQSYRSGGFNVYFPAHEFVNSLDNPEILSVTLHADPAKLDQVARAAKAVTASSPDLMMISREDYTKEMQGFIHIFQTVGYGLSLVIALIGILNYINTVITGVLSRRNEFAMLESIGMTKKQLKKMLVYEGLYSVLFTSAIAGTAGMYIIYRAGKGISENLAFTEFTMNIWPIASLIPLLVTISLVVTLAAYQSLSKSTIVERLRAVE